MFSINKKEILSYWKYVFAVLVILVVLFQGCATPQYTVLMHEKETQKNHYLLLIKTGSAEQCWDCYSRPDSVKWEPRCKPVKFIPE
jgi:hypothetical protein